MTAVVGLTYFAILTALLFGGLVGFVGGVAWAIAVDKHDDPIPDFRRRQLESLALHDDDAEIHVVTPLFDYDDGGAA